MSGGSSERRSASTDVADEQVMRTHIYRIGQAAGEHGARMLGGDASPVADSATSYFSNLLYVSLVLKPKLPMQGMSAV